MIFYTWRRQISFKLKFLAFICEEGYKDNWQQLILWQFSYFKFYLIPTSPCGAEKLVWVLCSIDLTAQLLDMQKKRFSQHLYYGHHTGCLKAAGQNGRPGKECEHQVSKIKRTFRTDWRAKKSKTKRKGDLKVTWKLCLQT